jgi:MFS family permease
MKRAWADATRAEEVRQAARGWKHAKAIDEPALRAIEAAYPSSRVELHKAWKVFVFLLACVALGGIFAGAFQSFGDLKAPVTTYAVVLLIATEVIRGSRISGSGADAATSFLGVSFLLGAVALFLDKAQVGPQGMLEILLAAATVVGALAAWRWGFPFYAAAGGIAAYILLGRIAWARTAWLVVAILAIALTWRLRDRPSFAPPHRRSLESVFAVSAAALYAAINLFSVDQRGIERIRFPWLRSTPEMPPVSPGIRFIAIAATALFPVVFFAWGVRARRRLLIVIGLVAAALSAATWRYYVPIGPRWSWLTACGAVLIGAALWAHRRLRDSPHGAWRGLTAAPLYTGPDEGISPLGALGAQVVTPSHPEPDRSGFTGGGGSYGGGGATSDF